MVVVVEGGQCSSEHNLEERLAAREIYFKRNLLCKQLKRLSSVKDRRRQTCFFFKLLKSLDGDAGEDSRCDILDALY